MSDLAQVLADARERATVLRSAGEPGKAKVLDDLVDAIRASDAEDFLTWLSEADAMLRSDRTREWLRARFPEWAAAGHAKLEGRRRVYRLLIVPMRANASAARLAGRRAGSKAA